MGRPRVKAAPTVAQTELLAKGIKQHGSIESWARKANVSSAWLRRFLLGKPGGRTQPGVALRLVGDGVPEKSVTAVLGLCRS